ncbi:hypothetical protein [Prolixibacter sp. NT017]|uniref:hypothetical protein n=1 Tax=Prolixibacter sp. NT017 TaxID=2652390 RepID=UPI00126C84AA|nr:hypothetical protein [Prolixibacter sp. NT017]GET25036.1 hypothetical protein NT017_13650 [Prolixibacter sp. NT017]
MKKFLILYMLLLFTACTENGALHHGRKTVDDSCVIDAETKKQAVSGPGLAISVIVNREIALHEAIISTGDELNAQTSVNRIASELP